MHLQPWKHHFVHPGLLQLERSLFQKASWLWEAQEKRWVGNALAIVLAPLRRDRSVVEKKRVVARAGREDSAGGVFGDRSGGPLSNHIGSGAPGVQTTKPGASWETFGV